MAGRIHERFTAMKKAQQSPSIGLSMVRGMHGLVAAKRDPIPIPKDRMRHRK